ncbi:MAG: hypothetical protein H7Y15_14200 [Pseudonocardia sp.]|nr:hypothetical protein [Pseudonocardia sp.]
MTSPGTLRFRLPITIAVAGGIGLVGATALATQRWWLAPPGPWADIELLDRIARRPRESPDAGVRSSRR